jgi:DNA-binding CsgD family transcriptional regulator
LHRWLFLGRDGEIEAVEAALADQHHVVLHGQAGSGKSRLAAEVLARAAADGVTVHRIAGSPSSTPLPLASLSGLLGGDITGDVIVRLMGALGADRRSGPADPILVVDDAHNLDDASAVAVHQIGLTGAVRLLVSVREGAPQPPAVSRLLAEPMMRPVEVRPLDDATVSRLLEAALDGPIESRTIDVLVRISQGNPLYLREIVTGSIDAGVLARSEDIWRFKGDVRVTPQLAEVITARLAPLPGPQRDAMELLAIGGVLDLAFATSLIGLDDLEELERAGLVTVHSESGTPLLDVYHPLHRELLRARLGPLARMRIERTLALAADGPARSDHDELRRVMWHVRGGLDVDPARLLAAARTAMAAFDTPLGAELATLAYRSTGDRDAALIAVWCLAEHGRHDAAIDLARDALAAARDPWTRAALRQRLAEELWWFSHDTGGALAALDDDGSTGPAQPLLEAQRAVFSLLDGDLPAALSCSEPLLAAPDLPVRFSAAIAHAQSLVYRDLADLGANEGAAMFAEASASPDDLFATNPGVHMVAHVLGMLHGGRFTEAREAAAFVDEVARSQQGTQPRGFAAMVRGFVLLQSGQPDAATRLLHEAEGHWTDVGVVGLARWTAAGQVLCHCSTGRLVQARAALARMDDYDPTGFHLYEPFTHLGRAFVHVLDSNTRGAATEAEHSVALAVAQGATSHLAIIAHDLARIGLHAPAIDAASRLPHDLSDVARLRADSVAALTSSEASLLEQCALRWEALDAALFAAELFTVAAVSHRRAGRSKDHHRCDGSAGLLLARGGPAATPPLASRSTNSVLSRRETEIAELAARGLTNRDIAQRLIIGERTVESHLYRVFAKLGITARDQIGQALGTP